MTFKEFPKVMTHPGAQPAVLGREPGEGKPGTLPPVIVNNEDQQEYYESRGYVAKGSSVPVSDPPPRGYTFHEYPKWVDGVLVKSASEHAEPVKRKPGRPRKAMA